MKIYCILFAFITLFSLQLVNAQVRIGIDGLSHDHVHGLLNNHKTRTDIVIVGIAEPIKTYNTTDVVSILRIDKQAQTLN